MSHCGNGRCKSYGTCHGSLVTYAFLTWAVHLTVIRVTHIQTQHQMPQPYGERCGHNVGHGFQSSRRASMTQTFKKQARRLTPS